MKNSFPLFYHLHHLRHSEDIPFWISLAREFGGPVLELGCGTGRVLAPLAEAGFDVYGFDHDAEMLSFLLVNLPHYLKSRVYIFLAELSAFHLGIQFPLIIMPCNTLSTLSRQTRQACLALVFQHLTPRGVFAASLPNPLAFRELPVYGDSEVEDMLVDPITGNSIQVSSEWEKEADRFVVQWHYDQTITGGKKERLTVAVRHNLALREDYLAELGSAGFSEVASFGSFSRTQYRSASPELILLANMGQPGD
jgi:SAM-dependent methyltransferase